MASAVSASTFISRINQVPAYPQSTEAVRVWIKSDTLDGETTGLQVRNLSGTSTSYLGTYDNVGNPPANWRVDIPALPNGTQVQYRLFTRDGSGADYGFTGFAWSYTVQDRSATQYQLYAGYNDIDVANDNSGSITSNNAGSGNLAGTMGLQRGIAIRPANVKGDGMPPLAYVARGDAIANDGRTGGATGIAVLALADLATSMNTTNTSATSNFIDTGLIPATGVQDLKYDPVTDQVWLLDGWNTATGSVKTIAGGKLGGAGSVTGGVVTRSGSTAALAPSSVVSTRFAVNADGGWTGTCRGMAVRSVNTGGSNVTTTVAVAKGSYLQVWRASSSDGGATYGTWSKVYYTQLLPQGNLASSRNATGAISVNDAAIDDDGYIYVANQTIGGRVWRFPPDVPSGAIGPLDVDDRAVGGTNGGGAAQAGLPVVFKTPIGPITTGTTGDNFGTPQGLAAFSIGSVQGLFVSFLPSATTRGIARALLEGQMASSNGAPYISAAIEDGIGTGASGDSAVQDSYLKTIQGMGATTQPVAGANNNCLYLGFMPGTAGDGSGMLFANHFIKDTKGYRNIAPTKNQINYATAALIQANVPPLGPELTISNVRMTVTSASSVVWEWDTNVPSTTRLLRGPKAPLYDTGVLDGDPSMRLTHHSVTDSSVTAFNAQYVRLLSWAPGYRTASLDISAPQSTALNIPQVSGGIKSSPVCYMGKTYYGGTDGKVYCLDNATGVGQVLADLHTTGFYGTLAKDKILGRLALRILSDGSGPFLYLVTDIGNVLCLKTDGSLVWKSSGPLLAGATSVASQPAVMATSDVSNGAVRDYVFVTETDVTKNVLVFKLRANDGSLVRTSPNLGTNVYSSPAVNADNLFLGVSGGLAGDIVKMNASDLTVLTGSTAAGEGVRGAPFIYKPSGAPYPVMYVGTNAGNIYALNASNGQPLPGFGDGSGKVLIESSPSLTNPYVYNDTVYLGSRGSGIKVYAINANTGAGAGPGGSSLFFTGAGTSSSSITGGVVVDPNGYGGAGSLDFGGNDTNFYKVKLTDPATFAIYKGFDTLSLFQTTPSIDTVNGYVLIGSDDGRIYRFPRN